MHSRWKRRAAGPRAPEGLRSPPPARGTGTGTGALGFFRALNKMLMLYAGPRGPGARLIIIMRCMAGKKPHEHDPGVALYAYAPSAPAARRRRASTDVRQRTTKNCASRLKRERRACHSLQTMQKQKISSAPRLARTLCWPRPACVQFLAARGPCACALRSVCVASATGPRWRLCFFSAVLHPYLPRVCFIIVLLCWYVLYLVVTFMVFYWHQKSDAALQT